MSVDPYGNPLRSVAARPRVNSGPCAFTIVSDDGKRFAKVTVSEPESAHARNYEELLGFKVKAALRAMDLL